jgi:hypothetical protein
LRSKQLENTPLRGVFPLAMASTNFVIFRKKRGEKKKETHHFGTLHFIPHVVTEEGVNLSQGVWIVLPVLLEIGPSNCPLRNQGRFLVDIPKEGRLLCHKVVGKGATSMLKEMISERKKEKKKRKETYWIQNPMNCSIGGINYVTWML